MLFMDMQYAHTEIAISCAIPIVTCAAHTRIHKHEHEYDGEIIIVTNWRFR